MSTSAAPVPAPPARPVVLGGKPTPEELRAEVARAEAALRHHLAGLRSELTLADVTLGGRPVLDHVRQRPFLVVGLTAAVAAALPILIGLLRRQRPRPDRPAQWWEAYVADLLDDAALRVRRGASFDVALRKALRARAPVIYVEPEAPRAPSALKSSLTSALTSALNAGVGFGMKFALDRFAQQLTGTPEAFEAARRADGAPVS